jgi:hypothetical protein
VSQPGDTDTVANKETVGTLSELDDFADYFVSGGDSAVVRSQLTYSQV